MSRNKLFTEPVLNAPAFERKFNHLISFTHPPPILFLQQSLKAPEATFYYTN